MRQLEYNSGWEWIWLHLISKKDPNVKYHRPDRNGRRNKDPIAKHRKSISSTSSVSLVRVEGSRCQYHRPQFREFSPHRRIPLSISSTGMDERIPLPISSTTHVDISSGPKEKSCRNSYGYIKNFDFKEGSRCQYHWPVPWVQYPCQGKDPAFMITSKDVLKQSNEVF